MRPTTAVAMATWLLVSPAGAAKIAMSDGAILITGLIQLDDEAQFQPLLGGRGVTEVHLNSPGGRLQTAIEIADMIRKAGLTTRVPYRATCASACTLLFAAGVNRVAHAVSRIAVHSAGLPYQPGVENNDTLAVTTTFARRMSHYGAPPSVVGKLVATPNSGMSLVTVADLEAWNVKIERDIPKDIARVIPSLQAVPQARPLTEPDLKVLSVKTEHYIPEDASPKKFRLAPMTEVGSFKVPTQTVIDALIFAPPPPGTRVHRNPAHRK